MTERRGISGKVYGRGELVPDDDVIAFMRGEQPPARRGASGTRRTRRRRRTGDDFVDAVAAKAGLEPDEASKAVDAALETIKEKLARGDEVAFTGFGKFSVAERRARQGVNPQTGERAQLEPAREPRFSPGPALKRALKR